MMENKSESISPQQIVDQVNECLNIMRDTAKTMTVLASLLSSANVEKPEKKADVKPKDPEDNTKETKEPSTKKTTCKYNGRTSKEAAQTSIIYQLSKGRAPLGKVILDYCDLKGMTCTDLSRSASVSQQLVSSYVSAYKRGDHMSTTIYTCKRLAPAMCMTTDQLAAKVVLSPRYHRD